MTAFFTALPGDVASRSAVVIFIALLAVFGTAAYRLAQHVRTPGQAVAVGFVTTALCVALTLLIVSHL